MCVRERACRHSQVKHHVVEIGVCQRLMEVNWRGQHKHTWRKRPTHPTQSPPVCTVCVCVVLATHVTKWTLVYQTWQAVVRWSLCEEHTYLPSVLVCETHTYTHTHTAVCVKMADWYSTGIYIHTHTHTHTHIHTHACARTHTYTHVCTHTV